MNQLALLTLCLAIFAASSDRMIDSPVGIGEQGDSGDGGPARQARLNQPFDLVLDDQGHLFFSDTGNYKIRRVDASTGVITTIAGTGEKGFSGDGGPADEAKLDEPYGLAIDRAGNLYFADRLNLRVRKVDAKSGQISTIAGTGRPESTGDGGPAAVAALVEPNDVDVDPDGRRLFIADVAGHRVRLVELESSIITTFAGTGQPRHDGDGGPASKASLNGPRALRLAPDGSLWVIERNGHRLCRIDPEGKLSTVAGTGSKGYSGDGGPARSATLNGPKEMALAPDGSILIVDTENQAIRLIDPATGLISTLAGSGRIGGRGDGGSAVAAELDRPHGVAVGASGAIWIGDTNNHRLRRILP